MKTELDRRDFNKVCYASRAASQGGFAGSDPFFRFSTRVRVCQVTRVAGPLGIPLPGAIYDDMARGKARQRIFHDHRDYGRFLEGLETTVDKFGFEVFSFVCMPNHIHLFFRTPKPNLSRGMQYLLSGYANWFNTRHRRTGHLFQGRTDRRRHLLLDGQPLLAPESCPRQTPARGASRAMAVVELSWLPISA